jgi:flavodoxin
VGDEVVRNGRYAERPSTFAGGDRIQRSRFHLDGERTMTSQQRKRLGVVVVKRIAGKDRTDVPPHVTLASKVNRSAKQFEIGRRCKLDTVEVTTRHIRIRMRAEGDDHIAQFDVLTKSTGGSDPNRGFNAVEAQQLGGIDRHRRHAHAGALNRNPVTLIRSGEAKHIANPAIALDIRQVRLSDELSAERVTGKQDSFGDVSCGGSNMRGRNSHAHTLEVGVRLVTMSTATATKVLHVAVLFDSLTGNTRKAAELIGAGLRAEGHEVDVSSVGRVNLQAIGRADVIVLGSWVHGAFVLGQAPALELRQRLTGVLPALSGKKALVFCTYALAAGKALAKMTEFAEGLGLDVDGAMLMKRTAIEENAELFVDRLLTGYGA